MWALAIGIAGDVTNLERIVLGRYERTELLPIRLGQQIKTPPFRTGAVPEMR